MPIRIAAAITFLAAALATLPNDANAFSCVRHIYNNTSCNWRVLNSQAYSPSYGNMYFYPGGCTQSQNPNTQVQPSVTKNLSAGGCTTQNGPCTIPAYCTVTVQITYTSNRAAGAVVLTDGNGSTKTFIYDTKTDGTLEQCPRLLHDGNTGGASMNDPANGDVSIGSCGW